jgi:tripartite-type tricarboxylate transporter receptor subunit TctC
MRMKMVTATILGMLFSLAAQAQPYPSKPIRIVIPFPPGNTTDIMSRLIAPKMSERLGQPVIVENRPGASGMLGLEQVAKSPADGTIIACVQGGNMVVLPHTSKTIGYDPLKDFAPISVTTFNYLAIVANPEAPFKTIGEMVRYAKANPGNLTVATNGEGGFPHLAFEHLRTMAGFTYTHIPYKGSAAIATDIIGGQVMVGIDGITGMTPHIKSERLRLLATTNKTRPALWPNHPVAAEDVPGYESGGWFGYAAPAKTPREIILKLNEEINRAMRAPDVADKLEAAGLIIRTESPEFFAEVLKSDYDKYGKLVKAIGFVPQ